MRPAVPWMRCVRGATAWEHALERWRPLSLAIPSAALPWRTRVSPRKGPGRDAGERAEAARHGRETIFTYSGRSNSNDDNDANQYLDAICRAHLNVQFNL